MASTIWWFRIQQKKKKSFKKRGQDLSPARPKSEVSEVQGGGRGTERKVQNRQNLRPRPERKGVKKSTRPRHGKEKKGIKTLPQELPLDIVDSGRGLAATA